MKKHIIIQCVRKVPVHLQKVLEVVSASIYTVKTELNNYTLYRYYISTAVYLFKAHCLRDAPPV
jgi:hypothetical protein